jgi:hypothetical protein
MHTAAAGTVEATDNSILNEYPELQGLLAQYNSCLADLVLAKQLTNSTITSWNAHLKPTRRMVAATLQSVMGVSIDTTQQLLDELLPSSYQQAMARLEIGCISYLYKYDICRRTSCSMVYRCEFQDEVACPACGAPRWDDNHKGRVLLWSSHRDWMKYLWSIPVFAE